MTIGFAVSSIFSAPSKISISLSANSKAVPGPRDVTTLPSTTTLSSALLHRRMHAHAVGSAAAHAAAERMKWGIRVAHKGYRHVVCTVQSCMEMDMMVRHAQPGSTAEVSHPGAAECTHPAPACTSPRATLCAEMRAPLICELLDKAGMRRCREAVEESLRLQHDGWGSTDRGHEPASFLLLLQKASQVLAIVQRLRARHAALHTCHI